MQHEPPRRRGRHDAAITLFAVLLPLALGVAAPVSRAHAQAAAAPSGSGLPLPRFVSLKADRVNLRTGPGTEYPTAWVFRRAGLPLEVVKEFEGWREVRDAEGTSGWVLQSFLSGRRTALVSPKPPTGGPSPKEIAVRADDSESAATVAVVEVGVIANVHGCDGRWCRVSIENYRGYLPQNVLWGVYPNEVVK